MNRQNPYDSLDTTLYRIEQLESVTRTMAEAARHQTEFNARVEAFMASARTWGKVGLLLYGTGQSLILLVLAWGIQKI